MGSIYLRHPAPGGSDARQARHKESGAKAKSGCQAAGCGNRSLPLGVISALGRSILRSEIRPHDIRERGKRSYDERMGTGRFGRSHGCVQRPARILRFDGSLIRRERSNPTTIRNRGSCPIQTRACRQSSGASPPTQIANAIWSSRNTTGRCRAPKWSSGHRRVHQGIGLSSDITICSPMLRSACTTARPMKKSTGRSPPLALRLRRVSG